MALREIKSKIKAIGKTRQVTRAMEAVSAAKMRKSQERALAARPYAVTAFRILQRVAGTFKTGSSLFSDRAGEKKPLIVLVTADRGLAGALNSSVIKTVLAFMKQSNISKEQASFITVGKKGFEYFSKRGYTIIKNIEKIGDAPSAAAIEEVTREAYARFEGGEVSDVYVAYSNFVSTFFQGPKLHKALPLSFDDVKEMIDGIVPVRGKYSELFKNDPAENRADAVLYNFEPSAEEIAGTLVLDLFTVVVYHAVLEARASEFSARMVAMRSASDKALEKGKMLSLEYNKARQSNITREVSEIVGGVEALAV